MAQTAVMSSPIVLQPVESKLPAELQDLVKFLYEEATNTLTKTISARITARGIETPLGVLSHEQIKKGEDILHKLNDVLKQEDISHSQSAIEDLSNQFYTAVSTRQQRNLFVTFFFLGGCNNRFHSKLGVLRKKFEKQ